MDGWVNIWMLEKLALAQRSIPKTHTHTHTLSLLTTKVPKWVWLPKWTLLPVSFPPSPLCSLCCSIFYRVGLWGFCGLPCWVEFYNLDPACLAFNMHCSQGLLTIQAAYMASIFSHQCSLIAARLMMVIIRVCHHLSPWYQQMWNQVGVGEQRLLEWGEKWLQNYFFSM